MTSEHTTYRKQLRITLLRVIDSAERERFQRAFPFLDAQAELTAELRTYYTDELLAYPLFVSEFSPQELEMISQCIHDIQDSNEWDAIVECSKRLLYSLPEQRR
ncbi:MAG: hypothetical protein KJZ54_01545 [Phycisphaerales bacterium]|nr:hypothetical protein [Phycisphaerales bacterium]